MISSHGTVTDNTLAVIPAHAHRPRTSFDRGEIEQSIPARFARIAHRFGDRLAICSGPERWTYRQVHAASNQVAGTLRAKTVEHQPAIAVLCGHGLAAIVALLGILKIGKAAVMVDPSLPESRIQAMLEDAQIGALLTDREYLAAAKRFAAISGVAVFDLDELMQPASAPDLDLPVAASQPAMLLYTSGTTGEPKAVVYNHRTILHRIWSDALYFGVTPEDRFSGLTLPSYGAALSEIFGSLLNGASLWLFDLRQKGIMGVVDWLRGGEITILRMAATSFRSLAAGPVQDLVSEHVRLLRLGGDTIFREDVARFRCLFSPSSVLCVALASTETNTICMHFIDHTSALPQAIIPVGWPVPDKGVMIIDEKGECVEGDEPGEIVVRSPYLASGYWRREALTAEKFLPDPKAEGFFLYRTGDIGRWLEDGSLQHVGRKDSLVKIRGHRVELSEVESHLHRLEGIAQAAVKGFPTPSGDVKMVGYVTLNPGVEVTVTSLQQALSVLVPNYMIPARIVILPALPMTTTGKVDRHALKQPDSSRPDLDTPFVAPRTERERHVATIWAEILNLDEVGVEDDFLELGGDSLSLMRMALDLERYLNDSIPSRCYARLTIRHLLACIDALAAAKAQGPPAIVPLNAQNQTRSRSRKSGHYGRRFIHRLRGALVYRGPACCGRAMPYSIGTAIQRALLRQATIQKWLFKEQCDYFAQTVMDAGLPMLADNLTVHLMANTWKTWRIQSLRAGAKPSRWITITGEDWVQAAVRERRGLIVIFTHQNFVTTFVRRTLASFGLEHVPVLSGKRLDAEHVHREVRRTQNTLDALSQLEQRHAILIAGEGSGSANPLRLPFYGRQLPVPRGPGVLAALSQAAVVAAFLTMTLEGDIELAFIPLETPTPSDDEALMHHYFQHLERRWPQILPTMMYGRIAYLNRLPILTQERGA